MATNRKRFCTRIIIIALIFVVAVSIPIFIYKLNNDKYLLKCMIFDFCLFNSTYLVTVDKSWNVCTTEGIRRGDYIWMGFEAVDKKQTRQLTKEQRVKLIKLLTEIGKAHKSKKRVLLDGWGMIVTTKQGTNQYTIMDKENSKTMTHLISFLEETSPIKITTFSGQ